MEIVDYLSEEELKAIAKEEFVKMLSCDRQKERLLTNMAYNFGYGFIKELITDEEISNLKEKTKELLLNDKTALKMFVYDKPDAWQHKPKEDLVVYNEVQKTIKENINIVRNNVIEELENMDLDKFQEDFDISTIFELLIKSVQNK